MRNDMIKVLTERPRSPSRRCYGNIRNSKVNRFVYRAGEDDPPPAHKEGMRYPYGYEQKEFSDLLGPLYNFLHSRVGKPWNKVHSEICRGLKGRSTQQQHLLDHVKRMVRTDVAFEDGRLINLNGTPFMVYGTQVLFVDPRDGILKLVPRKYQGQWRSHRKVIQEMEDELKTKEGQVFRRVDGIWYEITITEWQEPRGTGLRVEGGDDGGAVVMVTMHKEHKRQLPTHELRQRGLFNVVVED